MGLSNQERYSKILWTVKNIEDLLNNLRPEYGNEKLKSFCGKLWPALLNKESNSCFWVIGGGFDAASFGDGGFLFEALDVHRQELKKEEDIFKCGENHIENNLILRSMIGDWQGTEATVVEIYQWIENFYYAVNRYQDDFSDSAINIKNIVANLKGEIFSIISRNNKYFRGYLLCQIFNKVIDVYDDSCPLTRMINTEHLFHDFKLQEEPFQKTEDLFEAWQEIQFVYTREMTISKRILLFLCCLGRRAGEPCKQSRIKKYLIGVVEEGNLQEVLDWCGEQYKMYKQIEQERLDQHREHSFCSLTSKY